MFIEISNYGCNQYVKLMFFFHEKYIMFRNNDKFLLNLSKNSMLNEWNKALLIDNKFSHRIVISKYI